MKLNDAFLGGLFVLLALAILWDVRSFPTLPNQPYGPGTFPGIIALVMLVAGAGLVWSGLRSRAPALRLDDWIRRPGALPRMAAVPAFVILYILFSKPVGFPLLVPVLLTALLCITGVRPLLAILVALAATLAIWLLFARLLLVPLPLGLLTEVIY